MLTDQRPFPTDPMNNPSEHARTWFAGTKKKNTHTSLSVQSKRMVSFSMRTPLSISLFYEEGELVRKHWSDEEDQRHLCTETSQDQENRSCPRREAKRERNNFPLNDSTNFNRPTSVTSLFNTHRVPTELSELTA